MTGRHAASSPCSTPASSSYTTLTQVPQPRPGGTYRVLHTDLLHALEANGQPCATQNGYIIGSGPGPIGCITRVETFARTQTDEFPQ
eukprot:14603208-Alexandrium_andersonii.AAC.1